MNGAAKDLLATRKTLLDRLRNWEDQDSWQDFFHTYWRLIYTFARKFDLSDGEAQDVVQETLLAVAKQMPGFKYDPAIGSFRSWLLHTTQWRILDRLRQRERDQRLVRNVLDRAKAELGDAEAGDPWTREWDRAWKQNLFEAALHRIKRRVSPLQYQMFHLYAVKQAPVDRVVRRLGVSRGRVYLAKYRIQRMLGREIQRLEKHVL